jgi:hypothetical protein
VSAGSPPRTRHGIWLRNKLTALMLHLPGADKIMRNMQEATNAITLKQYPATTSTNASDQYS